MSEELCLAESPPFSTKRLQKRWPAWRDEQLRKLWKAGGTISSIAEEMGTTRGAISGRSMRLHLHFVTGDPIRLGPGSLRAIAESRTIYQNSVQSPITGVLKPGWYQRKLGDRITKGRWKGLRIYSLTLEERATCPSTCAQWKNCYGNHMGRSVRYRHGIELEAAIYQDLVRLERRHPDGFVIRLHILGDWYSRRYVDFWRVMLEVFPGLRVFGYTAWQADTPIGGAVAAIRDKNWTRFAVRTSGAPAGPRTLVVDKEPPRKRGKRTLNTPIVCPAQTGKTACCASCGLCWDHSARLKPIAFLAH